MKGKEVINLLVIITFNNHYCIEFKDRNGFLHWKILVYDAMVGTVGVKS